MKLLNDRFLTMWGSFLLLAALGISSPIIESLLFDPFHMPDYSPYAYGKIFAAVFIFLAITIPLGNKISLFSLIFSTAACYVFYFGYALFCFYAFYTLRADPQAVFILIWFFACVSPFAVFLGVFMPFLCLKYYSVFIDKSESASV